MEDSLGYSAEEPESAEGGPQYRSEDKYMLGKRQSSQEFLQYKSYHLHLKRKREGPSEFKNFPTSYWERLAFYRTYTNSPNKVQIMCLYTQDLNMRFWSMVFGTIFVNLPYTYVHVFLASYVPETPLYLAKMVPFMEGITISIIIAAIFELFAYVTNGVFILDFLFNAMFAKNPWNECPAEGYFIRQNQNVYCYHLDNIAERIKNKTVIFDQTSYIIVEDNIRFQFGQTLYYNTRKALMSNWMVVLYGIFIWIIVVICYEKIYSRWIWKVLHFSHNSLLAYFIVSYTYHLFNNVGEKIPDIGCSLHPTTKYFPLMNFNLFSVSLMAPPVVHILKSRSSDEIQPSRDSAIIVVSNMLYTSLAILTTTKTKHYMETLAQLPLYMSTKNHLSTWFIYFPLYFSLFYFGEVFSLLFFLQLFITEITSCIIHLELTLDIIMHTWKKLPRRIIGLVLITVAVISNSLQRYVSWNTILVMFFNKLTLTVLELVIVIWMYPLFKLTDDISFHHGYPILTVQLFCLITAPLGVSYFAYKSLHTCFVHIFSTYWRKRMLPAMMVAFLFAAVPVVAGMCYAFYKYVLKSRRSWKRLFAPAEEWGPKDYVVRQLRKDYDSRTYTNSEVSRSLSRHIFGKTEKKAYDLDISYDPNRRSTQIGYELKGFGNN